MSNDNRIIAKIKKCLELAKSNNEHESAAALRQAQKLMQQHSITDAALDGSRINVGEVEISKSRKLKRFQLVLIGMIAETFATEIVIRTSVKKSRGQSRRSHVTTVVFIGLDGSGEVSAYATEVLKTQLAKARKEFLRAIRDSHSASQCSRLANFYCEGWVARVREKVIEMKLGNKEQAIIKTYKDETYGDLGEAKYSSHRKLSKRDQVAASLGYRDGNDVQIHHGVGTESHTQIAHQREHEDV